MNSRRRTWVLLVMLVLTASGGLEWRRRMAVELREQVERERQTQRTLADRRLRDEQRAAIQWKAQEAGREASDDDREAIARLRDEIAQLKERAAAMTLPEAIRKDYGTPERLIALLTAVDVPLGAAQIHDPKHADLRGTMLVAALRDADSRVQHPLVVLIVRQEGDAWKLVVPAQAVEKYAAMLTGNAVK